MVRAAVLQSLRENNGALVSNFAVEHRLSLPPIFPDAVVDGGGLAVVRAAILQSLRENNGALVSNFAVEY